MRQRRTLLAMSQTAVGTAVGLTFQQIQKYERGSNRIGSNRLFEFAKVVDVPVSYFPSQLSVPAIRLILRTCSPSIARSSRRFAHGRHRSTVSSPSIVRHVPMTGQ